LYNEPVILYVQFLIFGSLGKHLVFIFIDFNAVTKCRNCRTLRNV